MTCDIGGMTASRVTIPNDDMFLAQIKDGGLGWCNAHQPQRRRQREYRLMLQRIPDRPATLQVIALDEPRLMPHVLVRWRFVSHLKHGRTVTGFPAGLQVFGQCGRRLDRDTPGLRRTIVMPRCRTIAIQPFYGDATEDCAMQSGRVAPVDNSRKEERKREKVKEEKEGKKEKEVP